MPAARYSALAREIAWAQMGLTIAAVCEVFTYIYSAGCHCSYSAGGCGAGALHTGTTGTKEVHTGTTGTKEGPPLLLCRSVWVGIRRGLAAVYSVGWCRRCGTAPCDMLKKTEEKEPNMTGSVFWRSVY